MIFLGIVGCHTEQMIFQYANIFAKPSLCFLLSLTEAPLLSEELPDYLVIFCLNDESLNQEAFFKS